ncbi:uncharacterized protein LOC129302748 [Prosopis cineraria]|uniref:uncharacterized protein LOC129302748 n=1 Tax=Prosopis cineraria TaxID=364024 RepID=UPI00241032E2|nr:uncharacterized protein LOC129302748 [Prosopis cineraria]
MTPSNSSANLVLLKDQHYSPLTLKALYKCVIFFGIFFVLILFVTFLQLHPLHDQFPYLLARFQEKCPPSSLTSPSLASTSSSSHVHSKSHSNSNNAINVSDIVFCIAASVKTWKKKKPYIESWWQPNVTRGYVFFEEVPGKDSLPWPATSPPYKVHEDVTKLELFKKFPSPIQVRILRSILKTFKQRDQNVKWFVMTDDDTVMVIENLVRVLSKYDHTKQMYVGMHSEAIKSNSLFAFEMAYGGGGFALSYPLMEALVENLEGCIERYTHLVSSDYIVSACIADLGVDPTFERGFHQVDAHGDVSGLLSAHPNAPFVSIHHMDTTDPIFPSKNRSESIKHLLRAAKFDHTRILQQTICHHRPNFWTFSVSWGYSLQIYESVFPRWLLKRPLETFKPWLAEISAPPYYMFNTRLPNDNPCEAPHAFFAESMEKVRVDSGEDQIVTTFKRRSPRGLIACPLVGHKSADSIYRVRVFSRATTNLQGRRECCNVVHVGSRDAEIRYRTCTRNEIIG